MYIFKRTKQELSIYILMNYFFLITLLDPFPLLTGLFDPFPNFLAVSVLTLALGFFCSS